MVGKLSLDQEITNLPVHAETNLGGGGLVDSWDNPKFSFLPLFMEIEAQSSLRTLAPDYLSLEYSKFL